MREQHGSNYLQTLWLKLRFYILIVLASALLFKIILNNSDTTHNADYILSAILSMANAVLAYLLSKNKDNAKEYKKMIRNMGWLIAARILVLVLLSALFILLKWVDPAVYIFSFIGFYILHQLLLIWIMKKETELKYGK